MKMESLSSRLSCRLGWALLAMAIGGASLPAQAQTAEPPPGSTSAMRQPFQTQVQFVPPPDRQAPRQTASGASRGSCPEIQSLLPETHFGLTTHRRPAVYAQMPASDARRAIVSLKSDGGEFYYDLVELPAAAGIVRLDFPTSAPDLVVGERYRWSMILLCGDELRPDSPVIHGWIEPVELAAADQARLAQLSPLEQAAFYGQQGIWYDLLDTLITQRQETPGNGAIATAWTSVLESVNLGALVAAPLVN
jgi:hypothetical protein